MNVARLRMDEQRGRPVLVEFWDFCRPNSLRTLPYLKAWHERYHDGGAAGDRGALGGLQAVANPTPSRRPWRGSGSRIRWWSTPSWRSGRSTRTWAGRRATCSDPTGCLYEYHFGEGAYAETERAIQELLGSERELLSPVRPEDAADAMLAAQTDDVPGPYSGPYEAGGSGRCSSRDERGRGAVRARQRRRGGGRRTRAPTG